MNVSVGTMRPRKETMDVSADGWPGSELASEQGTLTLYLIVIAMRLMTEGL